MNNIQKVKMRNFIIPMIFCLSGVIVSELYCPFNGTHFFEIYLPNSNNWNDELFYFKQIEGMIHYGSPRGYFGYNEIHAEYLSYGAWSVALLIPYALIGKILFLGHWFLQAPIWANLLLFTVALYFAYIIAKPNAFQTITWFGMLALLPMIIRFLCSGMVEALLFAIIIVVGALWVASENNNSKSYCLTLYFMISYMTLCRPYFAVLFLIPFSLEWMKFNRLRAIINVSISLMVSLALYFTISHYLCAPYYIPLIKLNFLGGFKSGVYKGIQTVLWHLKEGVRETFIYVGKNIYRDCSVWGEAEAGGYWIVFYVTWMVVILTFMYKLYKKDKLATKMLGVLNIIYPVIYAGILLFYSKKVGSRHMLTFSLLGILVLVMVSGKRMQIALLSIFVLTNIILYKDALTYQIPKRDSNSIDAEEQLKDEWNNVIAIDESKISWDNTITCLGVGKLGILYYLPTGIGINLDEKSMLEQEGINAIKARYVMLEQSNELVDELLKGGGKVIWEKQDTLILER